MKKTIGLALASVLIMLSGCSSGNIPTNTRSDPPTGVVATAGSGQVVISWAPTISAYTYNVYFANSSGVTPGSPNRITGITATTYTQAPVTHGIPYFYVVTAVNGNGESGESAQVTATP